MEWKLTLNKRLIAKQTEDDLIVVVSTGQPPQPPNRPPQKNPIFNYTFIIIINTITY